MLNGIKSCSPCCVRGQPDVLAEEDSSPVKNCLGKFFSSRVTIALASAGAATGTTFCTLGKIAVDTANSTGIAQQIGAYTIPWIAMAAVGALGTGVLIGSVICYGCSKSGKQESQGDNLSSLYLATTYEPDNKTRDIYFTESSSDS